MTDIDPYDVSYTQPAKDVIELAMREARHRGDGVVGSADLLVGVLQVDEGLRREVFGARGLTVDHVRGALDSARIGAIAAATSSASRPGHGLNGRERGPVSSPRTPSSLPGRAPVEASIALSIVFVATEVVHLQQGRTSLTGRYPWVVAFTCGLLHGFGFAGALAEFGLPASSIAIALHFFDVGVEIGQFVGRRVGILRHRLARRATSAAAAAGLDVACAAPYAIGGLACFRLIDRLAAF